MEAKRTQSVYPYLIVKNAKGFTRFLNDLFDAEEKFIAMRDDNLIAHAEMVFGTTSIMCADATEEYKPQPAGLFIYVDDADTRYAKALELGCKTLMGLSDQEYGRTCGVEDPYGNTWWITSEGGVNDH